MPRCVARKGQEQGNASEGLHTDGADRFSRGHAASNGGLDQFREAFPWNQAPRYLIHDQDLVFQAVPATAKAIGIEEVQTAPRSPWQNAHVERFSGSVRRECLDHTSC